MVVGDLADLQRIAILPGARRRGLGRELLDSLVATAVERGATRILLEVAASNVAAISLYESFGFATIDRRAHYYGSGVDAVVMSRSLEPTA